MPGCTIRVISWLHHRVVLVLQLVRVRHGLFSYGKINLCGSVNILWWIWINWHYSSRVMRMIITATDEATLVQAFTTLWDCPRLHWFWKNGDWTHSWVFKLAFFLANGRERRNHIVVAVRRTALISSVRSSSTAGIRTLPRLALSWRIGITLADHSVHIFSFPSILTYFIYDEYDDTNDHCKDADRAETD